MFTVHLANPSNSRDCWVLGFCAVRMWAFSAQGAPDHDACFIAGSREVWGASGRGAVSAERPRWLGRLRAGRERSAGTTRLGASASEGLVDAGAGFDDAGGELDQAQPEGSGLGGSQRGSRRHRVPQLPNEPVGGGIQDQAHLSGNCAAARKIYQPELAPPGATSDGAGRSCRTGINWRLHGHGDGRAS